MLKIDFERLEIEKGDLVFAVYDKAGYGNWEGAKFRLSSEGLYYPERDESRGLGFLVISNFGLDSLINEEDIIDTPRFLEKKNTYILYRDLIDINRILTRDEVLQKYQSMRLS